MGLAPTRRPARLVGTRELGEMMGCSTEVARDRVNRAAAEGKGRPRWLTKGNGIRGNRHYRINLSLFRADHPEYFEAPAVQDVEEQLAEERAERVELRKTVRAQGAAIRDLTKRVSALEKHDVDEERVEPFAIGGEPDPNHGLPSEWVRGK